MWGCGGEEQSGKEKVKKKEKNRSEKKKKMKRGFLVVLKHSVTHFHFHCSSIKSFPSRIPQFPQNTSLSLWMNTQTHTSLTHIYHTNQQPSMSSPEFKSLPNSSFSFSKQHTQSLSLSQNNNFSCESSKSISSSLLSHSSHWIQECD